MGEWNADLGICKIPPNFYFSKNVGVLGQAGCPPWGFLLLLFSVPNSSIPRPPNPGSPKSLTRVRFQAGCGPVFSFSKWARGAQRLHGQIQPLLLPILQFPLFIGTDQGFHGEGMCSGAQGDCRPSPVAHLSPPHPTFLHTPLDSALLNSPNCPPGQARERLKNCLAGPQNPLQSFSEPAPLFLPLGTSAPSTARPLHERPVPESHPQGLALRG